MIVSSSSMAGLDSASTDQTSGIGSRRDQDNYAAASSNPFAATLASVMNQPAAQLPPPRHRDDASSDLDAPKDNSGALDSTSSSGAASKTSASASKTGGTGGTDDTASATDSNDSYAAAESARASASNAAVTDVNSDEDALNPDFKAKLGRVISRMQDEYGYDVQMVEGYRPQTRQNFLYEQGRTRPGRRGDVDQVV